MATRTGRYARQAMAHLTTLTAIHTRRSARHDGAAAPGSPVTFCDGHRIVFAADRRQIQLAADILAAVQVVRTCRLPAGADLDRGPGRQRSQPRRRRWIKSTAVATRPPSVDRRTVGSSGVAVFLFGEEAREWRVAAACRGARWPLPLLSPLLSAGGAWVAAYCLGDRSHSDLKRGCLSFWHGTLTGPVKRTVVLQVAAKPADWQLPAPS